jgi:hypothetical protein
MGNIVCRLTLFVITIENRYTVQGGHQTTALEYADTRSAGNTQKFSRALSMPCDIEALPRSCQSDSHDRSIGVAKIIRVLGSSYAGIDVHAITFLPLPGTTGSLSQSAITIDTSAPYIIAATTPISNGVYEPTELLSGSSYPAWPSSYPFWPEDDDDKGLVESSFVRSSIPIDLHFTAPVAVNLFDSSCTLELLFDVATHRFVSSRRNASVSGSNGILREIEVGRRVAFWTGKGNRTQKLRFHLPILPGDYTPLLDYSASPGALSVECSPKAERSKILVGGIYRNGERALVVKANMTMPLPGSRASIIDPCSLVGSGHHIAIQGDQCCRARHLECISPIPDNLLSTLSLPSVLPPSLRERPLSIPFDKVYTGMTIHIRVHFGAAVTLLNCGPSCTAPRLLLDIQSIQVQSVMDVTTAGRNTSNSSVRTASTSIDDQRAVEAIFVSGNNSAVLVFGYTVQPGDFTRSHVDVLSEDALIVPFGALVYLEGPSTNLHRKQQSHGGAYAKIPEGFRSDAFSVRPVSARVPTKPSMSSLASNCAVSGIDGSPPRVLQVHFDSIENTSFVRDGDVYTSGESIAISVVFSAPIEVHGYASLSLDVLGDDSGFLAGATSSSLDKMNATRLTFLYTIQPGHSSSSLNFTGRDALAGNITARFYTLQVGRQAGR